MTTDIRILSNDSIEALRRDHERLRYEFLQTRTQLRAFMSQVSGRGPRPICRFTLVGPLTTSSASQTATITHQLGPGRDHKGTSITVQNFLTKTAGVYQYHGASGNAGKAFYNPADKTWHIFDMECDAG